MSGFPIVDLILGMIFIFFLLSIICSSATELWFSIMSTRAKLLAQWLQKIFNSPALDSKGKDAGVTVGQAIMDHCVTTALSDKGKSTSYINASNFVSALLDKITLLPSAQDSDSVQKPPINLKEYIIAIENTQVLSGELKRTFLSLAYEANQAVDAINTIPAGAAITADINAGIKSGVEHFRERLENWYNTNAERLSGTMKRKKALPATIIFSIIITIGVNADTLDISRYLYNHQNVAEQLSAQAVNVYKDYNDRVDKIKTGDTTTTNNATTTTALDNDLKQLNNDISNLNAMVPAGLPVGWHMGNQKLGAFVVSHLIGWLVTIFAMCLGAPFWFEFLNKFANLRGAGPKPSTATTPNP